MIVRTVLSLYNDILEQPQFYSKGLVSLRCLSSAKYEISSLVTEQVAVAKTNPFYVRDCFYNHRIYLIGGKV